MCCLSRIGVHIHMDVVNKRGRNEDHGICVCVCVCVGIDGVLGPKLTYVIQPHVQWCMGTCLSAPYSMRLAHDTHTHTHTHTHVCVYVCV